MWPTRLSIDERVKSPNYSFKGNQNRSDFAPLNSGVRPNKDPGMLLNIDKPYRRGMLHAESCSRVPIPTGTALKPMDEMGRDGGWFHVSGETEARLVLLREFPAGEFVPCPDC